MTAKNTSNEGRAAVLCRMTDDYVMTRIPKLEKEKNLIYGAIRANMLFRTCSEEELVDLVDAFTPVVFKGGSIVIQQGDEGEHFYVVESGTLEIFVRISDQPNQKVISSALEDNLYSDVPYSSGSAFGELALMYGSKRSATIRAIEDCKLWSIDRRAFRGITGRYKLERAHTHLNFLRNVSFVKISCNRTF